MLDDLFAGILHPYAKPKASFDRPLYATVIGKTVHLPGAACGSENNNRPDPNMSTHLSCAHLAQGVTARP
jgi:hypothetical protein